MRSIVCMAIGALLRRGEIEEFAPSMPSTRRLDRSELPAIVKVPGVPVAPGMKMPLALIVVVPTGTVGEHAAAVDGHVRIGDRAAHHRRAAAYRGWRRYSRWRWAPWRPGPICMNAPAPEATLPKLKDGEHSVDHLAREHQGAPFRSSRSGGPFEL
jgi:hypothetical protein